MPIHDWRRVNVGAFHDFHQSWITMLSRSANNELPHNYYALIEPTEGDRALGGLAIPKGRSELEIYARKRDRIVIHHTSDHHAVAAIELVSPGNKASRPMLHKFVDKALTFIRNGVHLLVADLFPPGPFDPQGIHGAIWAAIEDSPFQLPANGPLTLVSYEAGQRLTVYVEPVAVGQVLTDMPLFLADGHYVTIPLESTYREAYEGTPRYYRNTLESPAQ